MLTKSCVIALVVLGALGVTLGCGGRTIGNPGDDARQPGCDPPCVSPYTCDEETGECRCPPGECCEPSDCWCMPDERHCDGNTVTGCRQVEIQEDGHCGFYCEYPAIQDCPQECVEDEWGQAYCTGDTCEYRPTQRYEFTAHTGYGETFDCVSHGALGPPDSHWSIELSGTISELHSGGFTLLSGAGIELWVDHNLPVGAGDCLWLGQTVTVQLNWYSEDEDPQRCYQELLVSAGWPLLHAIDGTWGLMGGAVLIERIDLNCPGEPWPCGTPSTYAFDFWLGINNFLLHQGERAEFPAYGGSYEARNVRSFFTGECDDDYNYAFYLRRLCEDE